MAMVMAVDSGSVGGGLLISIYTTPSITWLTGLLQQKQKKSLDFFFFLCLFQKKEVLQPRNKKKRKSQFFTDKHFTEFIFWVRLFMIL